MSIERGDYFIDYIISGGTAPTLFAFEFPVKEPSQIACFDITPAKSESETDIVTPIAAGYFHVSAAPGGYGEGGSVSLAVPLAAGHTLRISRKTPATQEKIFSNQGRIRPEEIEDGLDRLVMLIQEIGADGIRELIKQLESTDASLAAADAAIGKRIDKEITDRQAAVSGEAIARVNADNAITGWLEDERADRVAADSEEQTARANADQDLRNQINSLKSEHLAGEVAERITADSALQEEIAANALEIARLKNGKMSVAPNDGNPYVAFGDTWERLDFNTGDPFLEDSDGYAVTVERPSYLANKVWNINPDFLAVSDASLPGDADNLFTVDADGYTIFAE